MDKNELKEVLREIQNERMRPAVEEGTDIDWKELLTKAWKGKRFIISTTCVFMFLGLFYALTMTRSYTYTVTLVPELGKSGSS